MKLGSLHSKGKLYNMSDQVKQVRIGDLLMQSGILSSDYIKHALANFEQRGLPIGKVLVMSGYLTEQQLRTAIEVQSLVNDGLLPLDAATQVLQIAHKQSVPLAEAFQRSGFVQPEDQQTNKLGQLLVAAEVVSAQQLEESLQTNIRTGLPLGHILCFRGFVSQSLIYTALLAQNMIRRGMIDRNSAIKALAVAHGREIGLEGLPVNRGYQRMPMKPSLRMGELLVKARILTESQSTEGQHRSLAQCKFFGEILVEAGAVTQSCVEATIDVQEMLDNGTLQEAHATEALLLVRAKEMPLARAVAEVGTFRSRANKAVDLMQILTSCGAIVLTQVPRDIQERLEVNYNQVAEVANSISQGQMTGDGVLYGALRCVYLIDEKILNMQQAIMALDFASKLNLSVDEAMLELGWTVRTRLRSPRQQ
jgi:hypothetical protein